MKHSHMLMLLLALLGFAGTATAQKKLYVIGSSTSACWYVNEVTECYVGRVRSFYNTDGNNDTAVTNLAVGGTNIYNGMPSTYIPPRPDDIYKPSKDRNISTAVSEHANVVIVNFPSNAYDVLSVAEIMYCMRTIRDTANVNGIACFISTSQPRTSPAVFNTSEQKRKMAEIKDSVLQQFGIFALDFWTGLINPADSSILYDSGDQIHMNAAGHNILFQRVLARNIFSSALLPASFLQFNTVNKNNSNIISWQTTRETDVANYEIQRSGDGRNFTKIGIVHAVNGTGDNKYQFTDEQTLKGWNYYKVVIADRDGNKHASAVMSVFINIGKLALVKAFAHTASELIVELQNNEPQNVELHIYNNLGMLISKTSKKIEAGNTTLYLNTPVLSGGVYHIKLVAAKGAITGSFLVH